ncbi:unnamed protein product [Periconia digitata]|uniref:Uncharacterized protein n=1 Tax=Periconia digitata TaxID=1303443 RepID=A0A9W4XNS4_9PLEO|nr:unnamed protein product [Periconia digitata]
MIPTTLSHTHPQPFSFSLPTPHRRGYCLLAVLLFGFCSMHMQVHVVHVSKCVTLHTVETLLLFIFLGRTGYTSCEISPSGQCRIQRVCECMCVHDTAVGRLYTHDHTTSIHIVDDNDEQHTHTHNESRDVYTYVCAFNCMLVHLFSGCFGCLVNAYPIQNARNSNMPPQLDRPPKKHIQARNKRKT